MGVAIDTIRKLFDKREEVAELKMAGRTVYGVPGSLYRKVDYDDAWLYALGSMHSRIMDVGANRGITALIATLAGDPETRQLLLVDASPTALGIACQNLCMNGFDKGVILRRGLVSNQAGKELDFFTVSGGDAGSIYPSHAKSAAKKQRSFRVSTTTIDKLAQESDFQPELVKLDVEGAELDALRGAENVARKGAAFFVEMHALESRPMGESAKQLIEWCKAIGHTPYYMKHHEELATPDMIAHRGRCHLLLLPSDQSYPDYLRPIEQKSPLPE